MSTPKKKTPIPEGLSFYKSGTQFRWRIYRKGRKIGASTEAYKNLHAAASNLRSIRECTDFTAIHAAVLAFKNRNK